MLRVVVALGLVAFPVSAEQAKRVLFLHSFGPHFSPFNTFAGEMRARLVRRASEPLDIYETSLEAARFAQLEADAGPFVDYLLALFSQRRPDLVVTIGGPAARFAQLHRQRLFVDTPLLITALEERTVQKAALTANDAVVALRLDLPAAMENILRLLPDTDRVFVVIGDSPLEQVWTKELRQAFEPVASRVHIEWSGDLGFDAIRSRVADLPRDSAVFYGLMFVDAEGVPHEEDQALFALNAASAAPMFGVFDSQLGKGVVGGPMLPVDTVAEAAAEAAVALLGGAAPAGIRPPPIPAGAPRYDARELTRWGIDEARLPPGSVVAFHQPTAWERYRWQIVLLTAVVALQAGFIAALLLNRRQLHLSRTALRRSEREARDLSGQLIHTQEDERARLARELHDDMTQRLAVLAIEAGQGERKAMSETDGATLRGLREELVRLSEDVHALSYRLHPSTLRDLGLIDALQTECDRFARLEAIPVRVTARNVPSHLPEDTALCLFRITQEALRNVARHARASWVEISLRREGEALHLTIADDGQGFELGPGRTEPGLGLASMRERARLAGGTFDVVSGPNRGTTIRIVIPVGEERDEPPARTSG